MTRLLLTLLLWLPFAGLGAAPGCVVYLGDSNTWTGGDDCSKPVAWSYHLTRNLMPAHVRSFARSGATWTNNASTTADPAYYSEVLDDRNVIFNQVLRLKAAVESAALPAPDFIFISAGTNDAWFADRRPGLWSETVEQAYSRTPAGLKNPADAVSLAASVRLVLGELQSRFPQARIIVVTPPYTVKASRDAIERVATTLQQASARSGTECVRIEKQCGIDPDRESKRPTLTTDGTHTSAQGAWQIANCVFNYLAYFK